MLDLVAKPRGEAHRTEHAQLVFCETPVRLADRAYIIEKGEIKFEGSFAALDADAALRRTYLSVG